MPKIFPRSKDGDEIQPWMFNQIYDELDRWRNAVCVPPLCIDDLESESPPIFYVVPTPDPVLVCQPGSSVGGESGTWPSLTPASFTADVYQVSGTSITIYLSSAKVYNWYAAGLDANKTATVAADGAGTFVVLAQSCT